MRQVCALFETCDYSLAVEDSSLSEEQKRTKMKSVHESLHDQINAVLTPEQQAKFRQMRQEQMQKHKGMEEGKEHE